MAAEQGFEICSLEIAEAAPDDKEKSGRADVQKGVPRLHMAGTSQCGHGCKSRVIDWLETQQDIDVGKKCCDWSLTYGKGSALLRYL